MKRKCILFDLDGTLMDSRQAVIDSTYRVSEIYAPGKYTYQETMKRFGEITDVFLGELSDDINMVKKDYMKVIGSIKSHPFKSVDSVLSRLKMDGYIMGIVTNKQKDLALKDLERNSLAQYFQVVAAADDVELGKPDPDMLNLAMDQLGVVPAETILVGDSVYDKEAAKNADLDFIMIDWYKEHQKEHHSLYIRELEDLHKIIGKVG